MLQIDHVIIAVRDLVAASDDYAALGFSVIYGGRHASGSTHNALISLQDGAYLELLAATGEPAQPGLTDFSPLLAQGEGLVGYAVRSHDLQADAAELRERGIAVGTIREGQRQRQDGIDLHWYIASIGSEMLPFLIEDITLRSLRVPDDASAVNHANGVSGIAELVGVDLVSLSGNQHPQALKLKAAQPITFDLAKTHGVVLTAVV